MGDERAQRIKTLRLSVVPSQPSFLSRIVVKRKRERWLKHTLSVRTKKGEGQIIETWRKKDYIRLSLVELTDGRAESVRWRSLASGTESQRIKKQRVQMNEGGKKVVQQHRGERFFCVISLLKIWKEFKSQLFQLIRRYIRPCLYPDWLLIYFCFVIYQRLNKF